MVKVQDSIVRTAGGEIDIQSWQKQICASYPDLDAACIERSLLYVRTLPAHREQFLEQGMELANLVASLNLDTASVAGALVYRPVRTGQAALSEIAGVVGQESADLVGAVVRMADTSLLEMTNTAMQTSEARDQVENVRLMLVSMIDDARVAVLKLAERVLALRSAKNSSEERRRRIAQEVHLVFVPLANRLGIWRLKWELEDLALRYLAPDIYKTIAGQLDGRREERESQIVAIAESVEQRLQDNGIQVKVSGRAKHIFSIWRKMSAKSIGLTEIYDVRAIRIVVADIASCYAALGIIHTEWQHIPSEFDDYIAVPKENGYRSIHTAVMGEDGKTLEVQIRTPEMHEEAELGVCAHWAYKDTGINSGTEDRPYAEKMNWLRQVVDWQEETRQLMNADLFREQHRHLRQERIFVYTPQGHVLDLTNDATPVDFAYRVHTEIGHRCIGARVDGARVALNTPLQTGQRVEILTGDHEEPQRTWLDSHLGFVKTGRAQEKIEEWFHAQGPQANQKMGCERLEEMLRRVNLGLPPRAELERVASQFGFAGVEDLYMAVGVGECQVLDVLDSLCDAGTLQPQLSLLPAQAATASAFYNIDVRAPDRPGLLLDITTFLSKHDVQLSSNIGTVEPATMQASIILGVRLSSIHELACMIDGLAQIPLVEDVRRLANNKSIRR